MTSEAFEKRTLRAGIQRDRAALDALVTSIPEARLSEPTLDAGWSVKDVLAHISVWEGLCASWLKDVARGVTPARPEVRDVDATNAQAYEAAKDVPAVDLLAESRRAHEALIAGVEALSDADLADESRFGWPVWKMVSSNSDEHYREHIDQIERWLKTQP